MRIKNKMVGIFVTGIHIAITEKKKIITLQLINPNFHKLDMQLTL